MRRWSEFGDQVNRLVYVLAGCKFQANIERANRFIAERISYGEVSVRMMRQGRFRPQEEQALEILVEIGKSEAELGREWAYKLLHAGQYPDPEAVLQRLYPQELSKDPQKLLFVNHPEILITIFRLAGGFLGSCLFLLLWAYVISPAYPAPHERSLVWETLWGFLIGLGLACGIAVSDFLVKKKVGESVSWLPYLTLPVSGILGALLWKVVGEKIFTGSVGRPIASTWVETFSFGAVYGLAFAAGTIVARRKNLAVPSRLKDYRLALIFPFACGIFTLTGFMLAIFQPAFANQKDVDMFVGILIRFGLIFLTGVFPVMPVTSQTKGYAQAREITK